MKKKLKVLFIFIFICLILYFVSLHIKIRDEIHNITENDVEYIIILGARVKGIEPSLSLQYRIDKAAHYLKKHKDTIAIASGGQGSGEKKTEAEVIKQGLIKQGIDATRIIIEDKSINTVENIQFSKRKIPKGLKSGAIVSSDYHLFRAKMIAKDQGLVLDGIPAKTPTVALPKSYIREYLAITKYYMNKLIF